MSLPWLKARALLVPSVAWNLLLGRILKVRRWWDRIDDFVILGAFPISRDIPSLSAAGVRAVVNTCEEYGGPRRAYLDSGIEQLWIPTVDYKPPSLNDVREAVEFIQKHVQQQESVYVHCKAGRGRSATVAICWLMRHRGMTPDQAQQHLLCCRPQVSRRLVERQVVKDYWGEIAEGSATKGF